MQTYTFSIAHTRIFQFVSNRKLYFSHFFIAQLIFSGFPRSDLEKNYSTIKLYAHLMIHFFSLQRRRFNVNYVRWGSFTTVSRGRLHQVNLLHWHIFHKTICKLLERRKPPARRSAQPVISEGNKTFNVADMLLVAYKTILNVQ